MAALRAVLVAAGVGAVIAVGVALLVVELGRDLVRFVYAGG